MKIDYALVLRQIEEELAGLDERRQALQASAAGIRRLVPQAEPGPSSAQDADTLPAPADRDPSIRMPAIPPGFFSGKSPTQAYRDLMQLWPGHYRPPQIADLFIQGGISYKARTDLVQAIHSVLKRERKRLNREGASMG